MTAYGKGGNTTLCVITATHRTARRSWIWWLLKISYVQQPKNTKSTACGDEFISFRRMYRCCDGFFPLVLRRSCRSPPADSAAHLVVFFLTDTPIVSEPSVGFHSDWLPSRHLLTRWCMYLCMIIDYSSCMYDTYVYPEGLTVNEWAVYLRDST